MSTIDRPESLTYAEILERVIRAYLVGSAPQLPDVEPLLRGDRPYNPNTVRFLLSQGEGFIRHEIARTLAVKDIPIVPDKPR